MTTDEIKTLIQNTIAGQGSQVDIGGKLAEILGAIVDAILENLVVDITDVLNGGDPVEISRDLYKKITASVALRTRSLSLTNTYVRAGVLPEGTLSDITPRIGLDIDEYFLFGDYSMDGSTFTSGTGFLVYPYVEKYFISPFEI